MVCIAAFIVLVVALVFFPVLRLINKRQADRYWGMLKKAWACVGKKVRFQKCETNFKDDVKNGILAKVVVRRPKLVKPLGVGIEIVAVLVVLVTAWSLLEVIKGGLALYVYGTCNVSEPASCVLDGTASCSIDGEKPKGFFEGIGNWFSEWGEVIGAVPARMKNWQAIEYIREGAVFYNEVDEKKPYALDILDPGCVVCRDSFRNKLESGFFEEYNVALLPYAIPDNEGGYKFANSGLVVRYLLALELRPLNDGRTPTMWRLVQKIFTEYDEKERDYQTAFNQSYTAAEAEEVLLGWLAEFGYLENEIAEIAQMAWSAETTVRMEQNRFLVEEQIKTKKIPTVIFDGKRHEGLYKNN